MTAAPAQPRLALLARCDALLGARDPDQAFAEAIALSPGLPPLQRARTELLYGEWLRRERRRTDSRVHLRAALEAFRTMGAVPWAACRALLRAEGIDVTADFRASDQAITAARTLRPDVAIVDVTPATDIGFGVADGLSALPAPPIIILTSSTDRTQFGARLNGRRFIAKADICATAIARLARAPMQADRIAGSRDSRQTPSQENERPPSLQRAPCGPPSPQDRRTRRRWHRGS